MEGPTDANAPTGTGTGTPTDVVHLLQREVSKIGLQKHHGIPVDETQAMQARELFAANAGEDIVAALDVLLASDRCVAAFLPPRRFPVSFQPLSTFLSRISSIVSVKSLYISCSPCFGIRPR